MPRVKFDVRILETEGKVYTRIEKSGSAVLLNDEEMQLVTANRARFYRGSNEKKLQAPCMTIDPPPEPPRVV